MSKVKAFFNKLFAKTKAEGSNSANAGCAKTKWTPAYITMTVVGIILCVLLIPIFVVNVTLTIKGAANKDKVPTVFGVAPLIVLSPSMQPAINEGDLIFIKSTDVSTLQKDDIIAFKEVADASGRWEVVTHRIIRVEVQNGKTVYKTQGDNNFGEDIGYVAADNVVGIYKGGRIAKLGSFMLKMQEPIGMALFIGVPVVLFIGLDVLRRYLYAKKQTAPTADIASTQQELASKQQELASQQQELEAMRAELERLKSQQEPTDTPPQDHTPPQDPIG